MPIFEYRCGECRKTFEKIVLSLAGAEAPACPRCGAVKAERLVSRFATAAKSGSGGDDFGGDLGGEGGGGDFGGGEGLDDDMGGYGDGGESYGESGPWGGPGGDDDEDDHGEPSGEGAEEDD